MTTAQVPHSWRVWCQVSGGVTGTRYGWLKDHGLPVNFQTEAEAEAEAKRLNRQMNGPNAVAHFRYWAKPFPAGKGVGGE